MKKVLNKKFSTPSKVVGKVLQRYKKSCDGESPMTQDSSSLIKEIEALKDQIDNLKGAINKLKLDTDNKEMKLANLAREKEKLSMNLHKIRRSNVNLAQQLEDERKFYYQEKETYCHEMNEFKKLKKVLSNSNIGSQIDSGEEIEKLRQTLEQTLQTNYNLSIKFLRMKETKNHLNNSLAKLEEEHRRVVDDFKLKIETLSTELKEILNQKFDAPLSPSNKKYLQLVNQNSSLIYENLCLQMQVDQLNVRLKRNKLQRTKSESNTTRTQHRRNKIRPRHLMTSSTDSNHKVIKIFEREKKPGIPTVTILNENEIHLKPKVHNSVGKLRLPKMDESKLEIFQVSQLQSRVTTPGNSMVFKQRSRSAPKIVQSVSFKNAIPSNKHDVN